MIQKSFCTKISLVEVLQIIPGSCILLQFFCCFWLFVMNVLTKKHADAMLASLAEFKSVVKDTKSNTKNIMKSISIHSDCQSLHFWWVPLSRLFIITWYLDTRVGKKYTSGPRYWNVPVLVNTGTFLVYQYCPKMWSLRSLKHASVIQKLTILEHKNDLVLSNTRVPVSGTWSLLFPRVVTNYKKTSRTLLILPGKTFCK